MKITNWILAASFTLFATVQYNDPDPWRWAAMYSLVALVCGMAALGKRNKYLVWSGIIVAAIWAISLLPKFIGWLQMGSPGIAGQMKAETPYIEFTREFLGLLLCILVFGWQLWLSKRKH